MVAAPAAVAVPCATVRNEGRVGALVAAKPPYVPVAGVAPALPHVEVDAVLVGAIRVAALRRVVGAPQTEPAGLPPAVSLATATGPLQGEVELAAVGHEAATVTEAATRPFVAAQPDGVHAQHKPLQVALEVLDGVAPRPR